MNTAKENSKAAFNQQAATYDKDIKGQHARSLYPVLLEKLSHIPFQSALDLGCGTGEMLKLILQEDVGKELYGNDLCFSLCQQNRIFFLFGSAILPALLLLFPLIICA